MIILKISLWIVIIAAVVGVVAAIGDLFGKKNGHKPFGPYERFVKRGLDAFSATGALIVLSPVLLVTAILVRVKLGSPVLFTQDRPGRDGKVFKLYKFRSMTDERDDDGNLLPDTKRLTKFGKALRASSLDELPELWNILIGDMSLIGPRPLAVRYLDYYTEEEHHRHDVRPGISGLAQTHGRNAITWEERFSYDLYYVEHISLLLDIKILFETVVTVLKHQGIGEGEQIEQSLSRIRPKQK